MDKRVDVAIIGAGTAGLSAFSEVKKFTESVVLINHGQYGTTCARIGCMPSKVLIGIANDYHRRHIFKESGIFGSEKLKIDIKEVMRRVRELRDRFTGGVLKTIDRIGDKNIKGYATFVEPAVLDIDNKFKVISKKIIIAAGSEPVVPGSWERFGSKIITTDNFFEEETFPENIGIIGTGVIGLELGLALSKLGINVKAVNGVELMGGLTDPVVNDYALKIFKNDMDIHINEMASIDEINNRINIRLKSADISVDKIIAAMGRKPRIKGLGLEKLGIEFNSKGLPVYNPFTTRIKGMPIYLAGDINGERPLLHEAADEGHIAGYNAVHEKDTPFKRRTPLAITFSEPNIAAVGKRYSDLQKGEFITGEATFEKQGRSIIMSSNSGILRIYGEPSDGKILGAEMAAPRGEHLAHHISWAIQAGLTVFDMLSMPYYHPTVEEGLHTALRDLAKKVQGPKPETELVIFR